MTQNHLDPLFRTVSRGSRGSSGVSSQKVQRVVLSIQSVLPSKGNFELNFSVTLTSRIEAPQGNFQTLFFILVCPDMYSMYLASRYPRSPVVPRYVRCRPVERNCLLGPRLHADLLIALSLSEAAEKGTPKDANQVASMSR